MITTKTINNMYRDAKQDYELATLNRSINQKRGKSKVTKKRRKRKTSQKVFFKKGQNRSP